jgi:hypothetical protein
MVVRFVFTAGECAADDCAADAFNEDVFIAVVCTVD